MVDNQEDFSDVFNFLKKRVIMYNNLYRYRGFVAHHNDLARIVEISKTIIVKNTKVFGNRTLHV